MTKFMEIFKSHRHFIIVMELVDGMFKYIIIINQKEFFEVGWENSFTITRLF